MPLETLTNSDHLNIKRLSTEGAENGPRPHFDERREISEDDWQNIAMKLAEPRTGTVAGFDSFLRMCAEVAILDKSRLPDIGENIWGAFEAMQGTTVTNNPSGCLEMLRRADSAMKLDSSKVVITDRQWREVEEEFVDALYEDINEGVIHEDTIEYLIHVSQIDRSHLPLLTEKEWEAINKYLESLIDSKDWLLLGINYAGLSQIEGNRLPALNETVWQGMSGDLDYYRGQNKWSMFAHVASNLKIISQFEQSRLKPAVKDENPLPQTRNF